MNTHHDAWTALAELRLPADTMMVGPLLSFLDALAKQVGFDAQGALNLQLVAEEAFTNVAEHAYEASAPGTCDVSVTLEAGRLRIGFRDQGLPFDFSSSGADVSSGIGSRLMRAYADEIHFNYLGKEGKEIAFYMRLPQAPHSPTSVVAQANAVLAEGVALRTDKAEIRQVTEHDAVAIARCVYRVYGYTYLNENFYYPDRIAEQLKAKKILAFGGFNAEGELVCYWGVSFQNAHDKVVESANAIVDPRYRGHGLFGDIFALIISHLRGLGVYGINSKAVTTHPASQKTLLKIGAKETGVIIANSPATAVFKHMNEQADETRRAVVMFYTPVVEAPARQVFVPAHHADIMRKIYAHCQLNREVCVADDTHLPANLPPVGQLEVKVVTDWARADLKIVTLGENLVPQLKRHMQELCQQKLDVLEIDFPLSQAATPYFCREAEKLGFVWCGVLPDPEQGDFLRLVYLNHVAYRPEQTVIVSDFSRELHDYVLAQHQRRSS